MTVLMGLDARLKMARMTVTLELADRRTPELVRSAYAAGADMVVVKIAGVAAKKALEQLRELRRYAYHYQGLLAVMGDLEVAADFQADLFHLTTSGEGANEAKKKLHQWALVGACSHNVDEATQALANPDVNYLWGGPAFSTDPTIGGLSDANILTKLAPVANPESIPWFAAGGITLDNVDDVLGAGARRIVVGAAVAQASDPGALVKWFVDRMRQAWSEDPQMVTYMGTIFAEPVATFSSQESPS